MYSSCLYCNKSLAANQVIEYLPIGRRLAFDAAKGRLWVVCQRCERWNLTPFEDRWEAIEECERRYRDTPTRVASDNIGLAKLNEGLELVRIGKPLRPEFAAWRYGDQFGKRRRRAIGLTAAGATAAGALVVGTTALAGISALGFVYFGLIAAASALTRQHEVHIPRQDGSLIILDPADLEEVWLIAGPEGGWYVRVRNEDGITLLRHDEAMCAASLIMPCLNPTGARRNTIEGAVREIERAQGANAFLEWLTKSWLPSLEVIPPEDLVDSIAMELTGGLTSVLPIQSYPNELRLAVEMAVNEENERTAAQEQLDLLEQAWKLAEEIAAIADGLLVPSEILGRLRRMRRKLGTGRTDE